jgi:hypothetical protein
MKPRSAIAAACPRPCSRKIWKPWALRAVRRVLQAPCASAAVDARKPLNLAQRSWLERLKVISQVHEELIKSEATLSIRPDAFCRKHALGSAPPPPAGHYTFAAGTEMQHDTSPHQARIGGVLTRVQTASLVLCYSRMIFFQMYPRFTRFECKAFLTQAIAYFNGSAMTCMVDNSNVVVAAGGHNMIGPEWPPSPSATGCLPGARKGDANRSRGRSPVPPHRSWLFDGRRLFQLGGSESARAGHVRGVERDVL